ncbi:MAG: VIT1/CCC1 family protein [Acidilobaceae archaeon]
MSQVEYEFCRDEYFDYIAYRELAKIEGNSELKSILEEFSEQERKHYEFWKSFSGDCSGYSRLKLFLLILSRRILGLTFTLKLLERHESRVIESYKLYLSRLNGEARSRLEEIIRDEITHEKSWLDEMAEKESIVKYLGFIALGLADAIVEITGTHAGFLGATEVTLVAGVAGLIVGLSAAISMSGAAYLQAKHGGLEEKLRPNVSALTTGIAYIIAVILLALPYFLTKSMIIAFTASLIVALILIALFTIYGSIVRDRDFKKEFIETTLILLATAIASFLFGVIIGEITGIRGLIG